MRPNLIKDLKNTTNQDIKGIVLEYVKRQRGKTYNVKTLKRHIMSLFNKFFELR